MAPYKSRAQQKYFHYLESKGKMPKKVVDEFDEATNFDKLPEQVQYAMGGRVGKLQAGYKQPMQHKTMEPSFQSDERAGEIQYGIKKPPHTKQAKPSIEQDDRVGYLQSGVKKAPIKKEQVQKLAHGGMVNYDYEMGNADEYDSSGEPHTEFELEDEHPMEYYAMGGKVKKMAKGGMAKKSQFVAALRKAK